MKNKEGEHIFNLGKITLLLIGLNVFAFFIPFNKELFVMNRSFITQPWRLITSIFLHANFVHLGYNMYSLFIYGNILEINTNRKTILKIILLGGIVGNLGFTAFSSGSGLGFSGSIYALILACAKRFPNIKIPLPVGIIAIPVKIKFAAPVMLLGELALSLANPIDGIAHSAHLFGGLVGLLL